MKAIRILVAISFTFLFFGCATSKIAEPKKITFEDAMEQVAKGLNKNI